LNDPKNSEQQTSVTITVHDTNIPVIIDSGASANVLDKNTFHRIYNGPQHTIKLSDSRVKLFSYGAFTPLPVLGKFDAMVTTPAVSGETASSTNAQFIVVNTIDSGCLLGKSTAIALGLLRVGQLSGSILNAVTMQSNVEVGTRTFCRKTLCRKTFCRKTFCRTDTLPTDVLPNGRFAERTFCRTDILPIGQFGERTINLPKIEMLFRQNVWDCDSFLNSVIINH
jgi:hypothetical protein